MKENGDGKLLPPFRSKRESSHRPAERTHRYLKMPLPKRDRGGDKEKEKEREKRDQRDNVVSAFRATSASPTVSQATPQTPTMEEFIVAMKGLLEQQDEKQKVILEKQSQKQKEDFSMQIDRVVKELREDYRKGLETLSEGVAQNFERVDQTIQSLGKKMEKKVEDQDIMAEARQMQSAIRVRGISETVKENLELEVAAGIAEGMEFTEDDMLQEFDRIYRANSRVAKLRGLPRDVVIYLTRKSLRDAIIRKSFERKFQVAGQEIIILKELPPRYIKRKREYNFLAEELRKKKIRFRWEIPDGLTVNFQGSTIRIRSEPEARAFFERLSAEEALSEGSAPAEEDLEATEQRGAVGGARARSKMIMELRDRGRVGRGELKVSGGKKVRM